MESSLEEITRRIVLELRNAKDAVQRNQCTPTARPRRDRQRSIAEMEAKLLQERLSQIQLASAGSIRLKKSIVTGQSHSSVTPLKELQPITLRDMKVPMVHTGKYLACRIISEAYILVATAFLIEDLNGEVEDLSLYNFQLNIGNSCSWLPPGTIMFIKEPYLKFGSLGKNVFIRVDSPSDVVFVDESDQQKLQWANALKWYKPQKLSVDQLRARGNQHYVEKNYEWALKYYKKGLLIEPDSGVLHLNMAAAYLATDNYHAAFESAKLALEKGADREKALIRVIDAGRIENLCSFNCFSNQNDYDSSSESKEMDEHSKPTGLWILPSFINHSCIGSASRTFYGDIMTVYAVKDLKKGEEITFPYVSPFKSYMERLKAFKHYNFICSCRLCQLDRSDPLYEQRNRLAERCYALKHLSINNPRQSLRELEPLVKEMRKSYGNRKELRLQIIIPLSQLSMVYRGTHQLEKAVEVLREAREAMSHILEIEIGVSYLLIEADCYTGLQQWSQVAKTIQRAMTNTKIRSGANKQLFYLMFPDAMRFQQ